uniref:Uncharacterized protein n=1 Tax=Aegilops tauschii TaxID=37682 RepID=M8D6W4_AEGTA
MARSTSLPPLTGDPLLFSNLDACCCSSPTPTTTDIPLQPQCSLLLLSNTDDRRCDISSTHWTGRRAPGGALLRTRDKGG